MPQALSPSGIHFALPPNLSNAFPPPTTLPPSGIHFVLPPNHSNAFPTPTTLPPLSVSLTSSIFSSSTRTTLIQTFYNPFIATAIQEACYTFPLYANCCILSFVCHIGSTKTITGIIQPKWEARATYDAGVSQGLTAGLLEQNNTEVFTMQLGNIPHNATVKVVLEYVTELKHDAQADGILFTIPTAIAPRYGIPPLGACPSLSMRSEKGTSLSVEITMAEPIRGVNSNSHRVTVQLGTHRAASSKSKGKGTFDACKALVTLHQSAIDLSCDITLLITTATPSHLATPLALLETHPTIPDHSAMMLTLVPRFAAPPITDNPDIIILVDRSGSMQDKITPLRAALRVFLKSLPIGCRFNIIGFGSTYYMLWAEPRPYSRETLRDAEAHVNALIADMGGTELQVAVQAVLESKVVKETEMVVLTDGDIWGLDTLLACVKAARTESKGLLRVFCLGIGRQVSHALVEGLARAGGGTSVVLSPGEEGGLAGKVVGILKCALGAHVGAYKLEIEYEEKEDGGYDSDITIVADDKPEQHLQRRQPELTPAENPKTISLFDPDLDPHSRSPTPTDEKFRNRFAYLKALTPPTPLQAPYDIPPLFPFDRTTVYLTFPHSPAPKSITLKATTLAGTDLHLSIPITRVTAGTTIHSLAARAQLRDLEEARSWVHACATERADEYVEHEGERVGVEWGIAGKWTSFVAVEEVENSKPTLDSGDTRKRSAPQDMASWKRRAVHSGGTSPMASPLPAGALPTSSRLLERRMPSPLKSQTVTLQGHGPQAQQQAQIQSAQTTPEQEQPPLASASAASSQPTLFFHSWAPGLSLTPPKATGWIFSPPLNITPNAGCGLSGSPPAYESDPSYFSSTSDTYKPEYEFNGFRNTDAHSPGFGSFSNSHVHTPWHARGPPLVPTCALEDYQLQLMLLEQQNKMRLQLANWPTTLQEEIERLISLQEFDGSFVCSVQLVDLLGVVGAEEVMRLSVKHATAVVAVFLENIGRSEREVWVLVVEKAWGFVGIGEEREVAERAARALVGDGRRQRRWRW